MLAAEKAKQDVVDYIRKNKFSIGQQLPAEMKLTKILGVSRQTLREATNMLKNEGYLYSVQGRGTFISSNFNHNPNLINNLGITERIRLSGHESGTSYCKSDLVQTDPLLAEKLKVTMGISVIRHKRVKTADGRPVAYSVDHIAPRLAGDFLSVPNGDISIYDFIENTCNIQIGNCITELKPVVAEDESAVQLEVEPGTPLMMLEEVVCDKDGLPLLYGHEYLLPDVFSFTLNRRR